MANIRSDTLQMSFTETIKRKGPCIESLLFISHDLNLFSNINTCYTCRGVDVKGRRLGHAYSYRAMWMGHFWCWDIKNVPTKINP